MIVSVVTIIITLSLTLIFILKLIIINDVNGCFNMLLNDPKVVIIVYSTTK